MTNTETFDKDAVMRRVQKLLAIAQDDRANPHEAASAAAMAEKIMRKYQLDHAEVIMTKIKAGEDMETVEVVCSAKTNGTRVKVVPPWAQELAIQIAKLTDTGCRIGVQRTGQCHACVRFYGYSSDVKLAAWMLDYLVATVNRLCNEFKDTPAYAIGGRGEVNSYRLGVAIGIGKQLRAQLAEKQADQQGRAAGTALMVVKQQAITEKYGITFEYGTKKTGVARGNSFAEGVRDGRRVDINRRAVENKQSTALPGG